MDRESLDQEEEYRRNFHELRPILKEHFPKVGEQKLAFLIHKFISAYSSALYEAWDIGAEQENLTNFRKHLRKAAEAAKKINPNIKRELSINLSLPLTVLNGTYDRKTCDEKVFESAPDQEKVESIRQIFEILKESADTLDKMIIYTQKELPDGIPTRNRNIGAWRIVEAATEICLPSSPDLINIPKRMGPYGPLYRLLVDLFEYYGMNANVEGAFNSWVKGIHRKREFLDLLPID